MKRLQHSMQRLRPFKSSFVEDLCYASCSQTFSPLRCCTRIKHNLNSCCQPIATAGTQDGRNQVQDFASVMAVICQAVRREACCAPIHFSNTIYSLRTAQTWFHHPHNNRNWLCRSRTV